MSLYERAHFGIIRLVHETLYSVSVDPYDWLEESGVAPDQRVLEVGCGPGFFTLPAAELVGERGRVVALDNNRAAVRHVARSVLKGSVTNVDVLLGDAAATGVPSGSQDLVFMYGVVHALWSNLDAVLSETHRVLKRGGVLSMSRSRISEERLVEGVTRGGLFRHSGTGRRVINFESCGPESLK